MENYWEAGDRGPRFLSRC